MASPIPAPLRRFARLLEREEFWASHEELEDAWRRTGSDFYQGLILFASAFVHAVRGNPHGITAQLLKAEERLARYRPAYLGVDVDAVLDHARRCRGIVDEHRAAGADEWARLIPFPHLGLQSTLIRGDEAELELQ